jgi:hypothetical protein
MAIELETAEIAIDTVGAEAVQQTLDALGVQVDEVNAAAGVSDDAAAEFTPAAKQEGYATAQADVSPNIGDLLAEQRRTNDLLERLIELTEQHQHNAPTY